MGIKGLTSYIERQDDDLWTAVDLKNTKVIIDGNGLFYRLYFSAELDCRRGGQYRQFHDIVCSFFSVLKSNDVHPFVVLDGASDPSDRKLHTSMKRAQESILAAYRLANSEHQEINVRPSLLRRTFMQALGDLKVGFAVCDFEADEEIASLANKWGCPVIAEDSDFFIFDLKAGYFPLQSINFDNNPPRARLFKIEKLSAHLGISMELLPLLASILGNDFVSEAVRLPLYESLEIYRPVYAGKIIPKITSLLNAKPGLSVEDAMRAILIRVPDQNCREELQRALKRSIESYKDCDTELATYFETGGVSNRSNVIQEPWVLKKIRQGLFPVTCMEVLAVGRLFLKPQVEDFEAPAADQCSLELRRHLYGFLGSRKDGTADVEEHYRIGTALKKRIVQPCTYLKGYGELPKLSAIPELEIAERRKLCLSLLESNVDCVVNLPEEQQIFAASLRYWYTHADPPPKESHVRVLIVCHIILKSEAELQGIQASRSFDLAAQHSFAQWQCVMKEAVNLNLILQEPLPTPRIRHLYDGLLVQCLVLDMESGSNTQVPWQSKDDFQMLYSSLNKEQEITEQREATAHHRCCTVL